MVRINVKMKAEYIYDLLLYHAYSQFSGFMMNVLGLGVILAGGYMLAAGKIQTYQAVLYLFVGIAVLASTPFSLKRQAKRNMQMERFAGPITYDFDEEGIVEQSAADTRTFAWDQVTKALSSPKDIAFYVEGGDALIVPKESFGDQFIPVMKLIMSHMTMDRIYIK